MPITWIWVYIFLIHTDHQRQNRKVLPHVWWQGKSASISGKTSNESPRKFHQLTLCTILFMCRKFSLLKDTEEDVCPIFSGFIFSFCNWCHQPTRKDIKLVFRSKMVYDVFDFRKSCVPCWGGGGLQVPLTVLTWPHFWISLQSDSNPSWCGWMVWHQFLTVHMWWKKFAITTDYEWISLGFFPCGTV